MSEAKTNTTATNVSTIPDTALEALARCLLPAIRLYFESEEGQGEFAEWKVEQQLQKKQKQRAQPQQRHVDIENLSSREVEVEQPLKLAG